MSYKQRQRVAFPPFSLFSLFIRNETNVRNDPSFTLSTSSTSMTRPERLQVRHEDSIPSQHTKQKFGKPAYQQHPVEDADAGCPIHKLPHHLKSCSEFRQKPLEERKRFLKDNYICFRCCASTSHHAAQSVTVT